MSIRARSRSLELSSRSLWSRRSESASRDLNVALPVDPSRRGTTPTVAGACAPPSSIDNPIWPVVMRLLEDFNGNRRGGILIGVSS